MVLYLSIIFVSMCLITALNIFANGVNVWHAVLAVTICTVFQFAIDGVFAIIVKKLPEQWFSKDKKCFQVSKKSQKFYEKLGVRKWKDKVWELGGLGGFRKNKVSEPENIKYVEKFIVESNKGIITHIICTLVGFLDMLILPKKHILSIALPVAIVNLILNILPIIVLRYNYPKLQTMYKRLQRKAMSGLA